MLLENRSKGNCGGKVLQTDEKQMENAFPKEENLAHSFLFVPQLAFIDDLGRVQISSPPKYPLKLISHSKPISPNRSELKCSQKEDFVHCDVLIKGNGEKILQGKDSFAAQIRSKNDEAVESKLNDFVAQQGEGFVADERILQPLVPELKSKKDENISCTPKVVESPPTFLPDESMDDPRDNDFSPRLTNYMESGFVPESPINDAGTLLSYSLTSGFCS